MSVFLITNPLSGSFRERKINFLISSLNEKNIEIERYDLKEGEPISDVIGALNSEEHSDLIFAFGDGTINSACNALLNRADCDKFNVLIFPVGTANVVAMELNCDKVKKSVKAFLNGSVKRVHAGLANDRYFISMASVGFDATAIDNVNYKIKKYFGKLAYILATLKVIIKGKFKKLTTEIDDEKYENILTCASNGKYYGLKLKVTNSDLRDNVFDVVIIKKFNPFCMLKYFFQKKDNSSVICRQCKNVVVTTEEKDFYFQVDGDNFSTLPLKIEATNKFLNFYYLG